MDSAARVEAHPTVARQSRVPAIAFIIVFMEPSQSSEDPGRDDEFWQNPEKRTSPGDAALTCSSPGQLYRIRSSARPWRDESRERVAAARRLHPAVVAAGTPRAHDRSAQWAK
jgi:hypothetical protein